MPTQPGNPAGTDARSLLRAEGPTAALERLKHEVRKAPRDAGLRTFLFQLFCVFGEWDRALTQLAVVSELDAQAVPMAQIYRAAIRCEMLRERVFAGTRTPTVLGKPQAWMSLLLEANRLFATGALAEAAQLRDAAFEQAPATPGSIDGKTFEWIADGDQRLGPVLEAIVEGKYFWIPFEHIARVDIEAPADLRDQVWMPAHFVWSTQGESYGFIPTRYPGSTPGANGGDESLALSRSTAWRENGDWVTGLGQRMLTTDGDEIAIMDLRRREIAAPSAA